MKTLLLFFLGFFPVTVLSQVNDDFSDGNFNKNPAWSGDTTQFEVNASKQLHLKSTGSDTSVLVTRDSLFQETEWDFWLKLSFNTSANNYARIFLLSDNPDLKRSLVGYYLQIGGANDSMTLVLENGMSLQTLLRASTVFTGNSINTLRIKVILDSTGDWQIFADQSGGTNFLAEGTYSGGNITGKYYFGVYFKYTTSNSTKFYFDDLYVGPKIVDTVPPTVKSVRFIDSQQIEINYSENVTIYSAENNSNYSLKNLGAPVSALQDTIDHKKVVLNFQRQVSSGFRDSISIHGIDDLAGNSISDITFPVSYYIEQTYDVLINEIMPDPDPPVELPDCEYVELYNRSDYPICLDSWALEYGNYSKTFPYIIIDSHGFLTLTKGTPLAQYGPTLDFFTSSSSLSNEGSTLTLKNKEGYVIHSITYSPDWFSDPLKAAGGWSIEQVDVMNPCGCNENWKASADISGGTPGRVNSVICSNPDTVVPVLLRAWVNGTNELDLLFSEPMDSSTMKSLLYWKTEPTIGMPDSVILIPPDFNQAHLFFSGHFNTETIYRVLEISDPRDCAGNNLDTTKTCLAGIPDQADQQDVIINEILPEPETNGERFVELFNRSGKTIDLKQLVLSSMDTVTNELLDSKIITETSVLMFPGDYSVLSPDPYDIMKRYKSPGLKCFIRMPTFPSYSYDNGIVVISRANDHKIIDKVTYTSGMQYPLLNTTKGVSLERLNPEQNSEDRSNWHSAAESYGFATPGYKNSEFQEFQYVDQEVSLLPEIVSPDNNGIDDVLNIIFNMDSPGYLGNVAVFDSRGRFVRQLIKNRLLSVKDICIWDGLDDSENRVHNGIYILNFELIKPDGTIKRFKKVTVVKVNG